MGGWRNEAMEFGLPPLILPSHTGCSPCPEEGGNNVLPGDARAPLGDLYRVLRAVTKTPR